MSTFESTFPADFRKKDIEQVLKYVLNGKFCQLVCVPGGGKETLLKLLCKNSNLRKFHLGEGEKSTHFIYLNLLDLPNLNEEQIDKFLLLALDEKVKPTNEPLLLAKQLKDSFDKFIGQKINLVLLFDHFDQFQNVLPRSFFQTLRSFKNMAKYKFAAVLATRRDLRELIDPEILREFYDFFIGNTVYLKLYDKSAITFMISQIENIFQKKLTKTQQQGIITITSGHAKLTKVTTELVLQENAPLETKALLGEPIIRAALFELWLFLTAQEQHALITIAKGNPQEKDNTIENLIKVDLLNENFNFTIPLFEQFVKDIIPAVTQEKLTYSQTTREITKGTNVISDLLSPQEHRLLKFLIENEGHIVQRDEIISAVWPNAQIAEGISDEAIDQMVFRLRKKIEDEPNNPKHITTIKGRGLRYNA